MRIECPHCLKQAVITSSQKLSTSVKDIYAQCTNIPDCGASFVFTLAHKKDLNPPIKTTQQLAFELIKNMPIEDRKALMHDDLFSS